jgi:hypothetical protein
MKIITYAIALSMLAASLANAQAADIFGYFEPEYTGIYHDDSYYQFLYNKLRVDLKSTAVKNTEFGADVIFLLYYGKTDWNVLDFLPEDIVSTVPPEMRPLYEFTYQDTFYLDNAYARFSLNRFAVTGGKQQISLGTGYFANPTDVFNAKDALDPTYEQPGHHGLRMDYLLGSRLSLMALFSPIEMDWETSGKLLRAKLGIGHFDFSVMGIEMPYTLTDFYTFGVSEQTRRSIGGDVVGELLGLGVWAEGLYTFLEEDTDDFYELLAGTDYTFESGLYTMLEYHHNSQAKSAHENYDLNDWMRFLTGETKTISSDQIYGLITYPLTDMLLLGGSVVFSVSDYSAAIVPMIQYSLFENIELLLMANIYTGEEGTAYSSTLGDGFLLRASVYY